MRSRSKEISYLEVNFPSVPAAAPQPALTLMTIALFFIISAVVPNNISSVAVVAAAAIEGCARLKQRDAASGRDDTVQSPPDDAFWAQMRDAYVTSVGDQKPAPNWLLPNATTTTGPSPGSGMLVPCEVKITPGKGRSVHAKQFIPKGTPVWGDKFFGVFHGIHGQEYFENFLTKLTWEQACDALQWCFAYDLSITYNLSEWDFGSGSESSDDDDYIGVGCMLDEASMINHGATALGEPNIFYDQERRELVALKDIQPGEEVVEDYNEFDHDLEWFDNLANKAWGGKAWAQEQEL